MDNQKKKPLYLTRVFFWSAAVCSLVSFFGPFAWKVYDYNGLALFYFFEVLFLFGLFAGRFFVLRNHDVQPAKARYAFNRKGYGVFLVAVSLLSVIACAYLLFKFGSYYGDVYEFGEASYEFAEEGRSVFDKACTVFLQLGMASYLLALACECNFSGVRKAVSIAGFWTTAVYYTVSGSRFPVIVGLVVFVVANRQQSLAIVQRAGEYVRKWWQKGFVILLVVVIVAAVGVITTTRMSVSTRQAQNHYEFVQGDSPLKESWNPLASNDNALNNAVFSLFDYVGEAPFVFSAYYSLYMPDDIYWAENTLRSLGQFLRPLGIDLIQSQSDIYTEIGGGTGKYSGFGWTLIVDFGVIGALIMSFLYGFLFAKVERNRNGSPFLSALYPCVCAAVVFAPIYYFYIARLDYVFLGMLILWVLQLPFRQSGFLPENSKPSKARKVSW